MEKDLLRSNTNSSRRTRDQEDGSNITDSARQTASDFVLQWGNRKRLRCMKVQVKEEPNGSLHRVGRRRTDKDGSNYASGSSNINNGIINHNNGSHLNLRHRPSPPPQRLLRNSEHSTAMRAQSNGAALRRITSPDRGARDKRSHHQHHLSSNGHDNSNSYHNGNTNNNGNRSAQSSETAHDGKKAGTSSGSGDVSAVPIVWPPKFVIALTNKEKEEDFYAFKGSKLPQRPKKRAKLIQRTLNLVSPGTWLCDLTLERYEVREKKITKKRARGLKAMGTMESDSE